MNSPNKPRTSIFDPSHRRASVTILTLVGLSAFEGLAVVAALPAFATDLGHVELLPWVVTAYMLCSGVATVAAGAMIDAMGVSRVFRGAVSAFIVGSLVCGFAPDMITLVAGRTLQGAGAGAINAVGLSAIGLIYPQRLVGRAFAANANVWGVMSVAGPAIAAAMLSFASWRWLFLINLPLGAIALTLGWSVLPGPRPTTGPAPTTRRRRHAFDLALLTAFSVLSLLAVDAMNLSGIPFALAALAVAWWLMRRARGRADALLAPRHAISAPLGPLSWGISALLVGGIGTQTFVPLFVTGGRGVATADAAWTVLFFVLGWTTGANISSRLMDRLPTRQVILLGASLVPITLFGIGTAVLLNAPLIAIFALLPFAGMGCGMAGNSAVTWVRSLVRDEELGRATAAHQFIRNLGFAVGNALVGAVLLFVVGRQTGDVDQIRGIGAEGAGAVEVSSEVASAIGLGFGFGVLAAATVASVGLLTLWRLHRAPEVAVPAP